MRILIADDDNTSRAVLGAVLRKIGHDLVETSNGAQAWEVLKKPDAPRLAVLDWMMPEMDGIEVVRKVRANPAGEPIHLIMLTAKAEKQDIVAGLEAGANDFLSKPFDPGELRARIEVGCQLINTRLALEQKVEELQEALGQIKTLRGILPICSGCKKIRDDKGYWQQVEVYLQAHSDAEFSHGLCPECLQGYYPELSDKSR
ncbi:MAG: response regulator [Verrucomicrobia bacterium]|nr:response regulator [Verrucomicrobiota bacterium]MCH8512214.1 response regulator [Kiritimatiellia bacterium]